MFERRPPRFAIACAADSAYLKPLVIMLESLMSSNDWLRKDQETEVVVLTSNEARLSVQAAVERVNAPISVRTVNYTDDDHSLNLREAHSESPYHRLQLPLLYLDSSRIIYLDIDILVLADIRPLLRRRLIKPFAAVVDTIHSQIGVGVALEDPNIRSRHAGSPYFNSGVMVISPRSAVSLFTDAQLYARSHPTYCRFWDQDALNAVAIDQWEPLPPEWNVQIISAYIGATDFYWHPRVDGRALQEFIALEAQAKIAHFAGPLKPWNAQLSSHLNR